MSDDAEIQLSQLPDEELQEWGESLDGVRADGGPARAERILEWLRVRAQMAMPRASSFGARSVTARDMHELSLRESDLLARLEALTSTPRARQRLAYQAGKGL